GDVTLKLGQPKEALAYFEELLAVRQRLAVANPQNGQAQRDLSLSYNRLGDVTLQLGQTQEALDFYQRCLAVSQRLTEADPKNAVAQRDLSVIYSGLGEVSQKMKDYPAAIGWYRKAMKIAETFDMKDDIAEIRKLIEACEAAMKGPPPRELAPPP